MPSKGEGAAASGVAGAKRKGAAGCAIAGLVFLFAVIALTTCIGQVAKHAPPPAPPPPKDLATDLMGVHNISDVKLFEGGIELRIYIKDAWDEASYLDETFETVKQVGIVLQRDRQLVPASTVNVFFMLDTDVQDRLGNTSRDKVLSVAYPASDLLAANFSNLNAAEVADLANGGGASSGAGARIISAWCSKPSNADRAARYCAM